MASSELHRNCEHRRGAVRVTATGPVLSLSLSLSLPLPSLFDKSGSGGGEAAARTTVGKNLGFFRRRCCRRRGGGQSRRRSIIATGIPRSHRTSASWPPSTPPSAPLSSPRPAPAAPPSTGPILTPPASSPASSSCTTTASTGGFQTGNSALRCQTDRTISIGLRTYYPPSLFRREMALKEGLGGLILGQEPIAYIHFLGHLCWGGVLWGQYGKKKCCTTLLVDVTDVALEWAAKNVESNPHLSELIEIRNANDALCSSNKKPTSEKFDSEVIVHPTADVKEAESLDSRLEEGHIHEPPILVGVVKDGENFDFCMCNPPFFESIEEAGLNPKTACGGTSEEMVCTGGERAFITCIIEDSVSLKHSFCWFTSMVGRKANLKFLVSKLHEVGVSMVKTTEFVQGHTARWGLAWSFLSPSKKFIVSNIPTKNHYSFILEGLQRQFGAFQILKSVESFFQAIGAFCKSDFSSFCVNITLSSEQTGIILRDSSGNVGQSVVGSTSNESTDLQCPLDGLSFRVSVFEQIPGTLLVKGSMLHKDSPLSGAFSSLFFQLEEALKKEVLNKSHER